MKRLFSTPLLAALLSAALAGPAWGQGTDVVGGSSTTAQEWPWQVGVAHPPSAGGDGFDRQFCGGSLIAPTVVLTAGHCTYDTRSSDFQPPTEFSLITGTTTLSDSDGSNEIPAIDVIYPVAAAGGSTAMESQLGAGHGTFRYDPNTTKWDFTLIELARPAPQPAQPIQLATSSDYAVGDDVWVTGWGDTSPGGVAGLYSDELQEAEVQLTSDAACATPYAAAAITIDPDTMICAEAPGKDTCAGDSGGPMVKDISGAGDWRLIGDTSFGVGCATPPFPGVYGEVAGDAMRPAVLAGVDYAQTHAPDPATGGGGAGSPQTPSGDDAACNKARAKLDAAKKRLRRLKHKDAAKRRINHAKHKVKKAKQKVKAVCA